METVKVTLYEISGYILPGIITLVSFLAIFTILNHGFFYIHESKFTIAFVIVSSYFFGHLNQAIANLLSSNCENKFIEKRVFDIDKIKLNNDINPEESNNISFKIIMNMALSKNYKTSEMDTYIEREGFYRGSSIGFCLLTVAITTSAFFPDIKLYSKEYELLLGFSQKIVINCFSAACTLLFYKRYIRFLEYRINLMIDVIKAGKITDVNPIQTYVETGNKQ